MFTFTSVLPPEPTNYNPTHDNQTSIAYVDSLDPNHKVNFSLLLSPANATAETLTIPDGYDTTFTATLPSGTETVESVTIGGVTYSLGDIDNLQPGEFSYSPDTNILTVYPAAAVEGQLSYSTINRPPNLKTTDYLGIPSLFATWNASSLSLSRSFEGHPTLSFEFARFGSDADILSFFDAGNELFLFGMRYMCEGKPEITYVNNGLKRVSVGLTGKWAQHSGTGRSPLDEPVKVKGNNSLAKVCRAGQVAYYGTNISIYVEPDTSSTATTTIRSELESRAIVGKGFTFYSNPYGVEVRRWRGVPIHTLSNRDIKPQEYTISRPGYGASVGGVRLTDELRNAVLNLEQISEEEKNITQTRTTIEGEIPDDVEILRSSSAAWDSGGQTRTITTTTELNGSVIEEKREVYGLVYAASDVHLVYLVNGEPKVFFDPPLNTETLIELVEETTRIVAYDNERYKAKETLTGWRLSRLKQESNNESIELSKEMLETTVGSADYQQLLNERKAYTDTFRLTVSDVTEYELTNFDSAYGDIESSEEEDYIPPRYTKSIYRIDSSQEIRPDPASTEEDPKPDIIVGKDYEELEETVILVPSSEQKKPERFLVRSFQRSAEGQNKRNSFVFQQSSENFGRPGEADKITLYDEDTTNQPPPTEDHSKFKYLLNTQGSGKSSNDPDGESISYPDVFDPQTGRAIAEVDYSIKNTQNAETVTLELFDFKNWDEGDLVAWNGKLWVIFSNNANFKLEAGQAKVESSSLSLGRLVTPRVNLIKVAT